MVAHDNDSLEKSGFVFQKYAPKKKKISQEIIPPYNSSSRRREHF